MPGRQVISTWFYENTPGDPGTYAQMRGQTSGEGFRDVYRRCLALFFATARRAQPAADLVLFTNQPLGERTDIERHLKLLLGQLDVRTIVIPYTYAPPMDWPAAWRNQFYVLDVINALSASPDDTFVVLDSDIVWTGETRTGELWRRLEESGSLTYAIDYPPDFDINGLTRTALTGVASSMGLTLQDDLPLTYCGGEFVALRGDVGQRVSSTARSAWAMALELHAAGKATFSEEAHLLSYVYAALGLPPGSANDLIRRIWTSSLTYRDSTPADLGLALWHVPAEKRFGLRRLYRQLRTTGIDAFLSQSQDVFVAQTAAALGIGANSLWKGSLDLSYSAWGRLRSKVS